MTRNATRLRSASRFIGCLLAVTVCMAAHATDLTVSAAASLTNAFRELAPLFEARHPGTQVLLNFAASDALLAQIAKGAPADVFAAADQESMDRANAQKLLVAGSRRNFVGNAMVLAVPADSALVIAKLGDLQRPQIKRIALGAPASVPAGRYALGALKAANLWPALEPKVVYAQSVRQALDYIARGEVGAGFVYATDAALMKDKVKVALGVPTETRVLYPIAALASSPNTGAAAQFIDFVMSPQAQAVFMRYGFNQP
jgi:molybdate transport system substrate-binding protein